MHHRAKLTMPSAAWVSGKKFQVGGIVKKR